MKHGPSSLLVLLTRFARTYGAEKCYPGQAYLAKRFDVDTRTIRRWTDQLVSEGKIVRHRRGPKSLRYSVIIQQHTGRNVRSFVRSNVRLSAFHPYINYSSFNGEEQPSPSRPVENQAREEWLELERFAAAHNLPMDNGADFDAAYRLMYERKPAASAGLSLVAAAGKR